MSREIPARLSSLRAYLLALGADVAARGKFSAEGANKIEAVAGAVINGGGAMAAQMYEDMRALAAEGATLARPVIENVLADVAQKFAHRLAEKGISAVADALGNAERRKVGKAFMAAGRKR